jgi:phage/plasmid primase-like uncharacterized protein
MQETLDAFAGAMRAAGLNPPPDISADGQVHRFATGQRANDDAGWYVLHGDGLPAGAFGDWRTGATRTWRANGQVRRGPGDAPALRRALRRERPRDAEPLATEARLRAAGIWEGAPAAHAGHAYLARKAIGAHGLRTYRSALIVPMRDAGGELHSLQFIAETGVKRFLGGGRTGGCFHLIGTPADTLCIAEGYATAASIHEATGLAVAVAFSARNLPAVAQALRMRHPQLDLVVCADDDIATVGNPGLAKAREAAAAINARLAIPQFPGDRPPGASDFNDLARHAGAAAVRDGIAAAAALASAAMPHWPAPKPIVAALKPVPAFDATVLLPEPFAAWIMDEADRMPCPPEFVAAPALVALGSLVGARCGIRPKSRDPWLVVPNLWGGIVGDPAAKKSPAWTAALKPLDALIARAAEKHRTATEAFETANVVFGAEKDAIEARIKEVAKKPAKGNLVSIAAELQEHRRQEPDAPTLRRFKTNDCTAEKLGELLRDNPAGMLVLRDELVGLLATWEREGREGERAFFLEAWNGNQAFDTDRIGRGHIAIANLCVSVFGGIQPDKLTVCLEQATRALANDGMLQRFQMLVYPEHRRWEWRDRPPLKGAKDAVLAVFEALADFDPVALGATPADEASKFPWFRFADDAQALFIEWSEDLHLRRIPNEEDPIVRQHLAKFDKLFPALALLFHLASVAVDRMSGPVSREAGLRAAAWCEFLEAHARRCYGLLKDDGLRAAQALADKLKRGAIADGFTLRDVRRNQWRNLTADEAIQAALDWLEDEDWLRGEISGGTGPGSGRRTVRYQINPAVRSPRSAIP